MARPVIALDLDGVLADFRAGWQGVDVIGDPIPGAREFAEALYEFADILIYTARCGEDLNGTKATTLRRNAIRDWLEKHSIPYTDIWTGRGKPTARAYVDDCAVECAPHEAGDGPLGRIETFAKAYSRALKLCGLTTIDRREMANVLRDRLAEVEEREMKEQPADTGGEF